MSEQQNKIADAIDGVGVEISNAFYTGVRIGLDTETFNQISYMWNETNTQLERIAVALEIQNVEEA